MLLYSVVFFCVFSSTCALSSAEPGSVCSGAAVAVQAPVAKPPAVLAAKLSTPTGARVYNLKVNI